MAERARPEVAGEEGQQQKRLRGVEGSGAGGQGGASNDPRTVFVGGILPDSTADDLRNFLVQFGEIVECKVVTDVYTGRNKGYAFVTFADQAVSDSLKSQAEVEWSGRRLNIGAAVRGAGALKDDLDKKAFVGGLPSTEAKIVVDRATGNSKGYAFVTFADAETARMVKQRQTVEIEGKTVNVGSALRNNNKMTSGNFRGGMRGGFSGRGGYGNFGGGYDQGYGGYGQSYGPPFRGGGRGRGHMQNYAYNNQGYGGYGGYDQGYYEQQNDYGPSGGYSGNYQGHYGNYGQQGNQGQGGYGSYYQQGGYGGY